MICISVDISCSWVSDIYDCVSKLINNGAEDEREFDNGEGSEKGPHRWGELKKEWAACKNGEMQSPIDMSNQRVKIILRKRELKRDYKPANALLKNRGHDISVIIKDISYIYTPSIYIYVSPKLNLIVSLFSRN